MEPLSNSQYAAAALGSLPKPESIARGLWSVPIPMPGKFLAYTLAVVSAPEGAAVCVIDPGWRSASGLDLFSSFLASIGRRIADVETIVITHIHPDHFGLVEDIREKSGAQVMMRHREQEAQDRGREGGSKALRDRFESWGLPQAKPGQQGFFVKLKWAMKHRRESSPIACFTTRRRYISLTQAG